MLISIFKFYLITIDIASVDYSEI